MISCDLCEIDSEVFNKIEAKDENMAGFRIDLCKPCFDLICDVEDFNKALKQIRGGLK